MMLVAEAAMATPALSFSASHALARTSGSCAIATPFTASLCRLRSIQPSAPLNKSSHISVLKLAHKRLCRPLSISTVSTTQNLTPAITLSDKALSHLRKLREQQNKDLCLRIGVRQGGCSGMSYVMDFEERTNMRADDSIIDFEGFTMICDPKSLLFLYGMQLDYSDALIGGGFSFNNPNATSKCGCGKSFAA